MIQQFFDTTLHTAATAVGDWARASWLTELLYNYKFEKLLKKTGPCDVVRRKAWDFLQWICGIPRKLW